MNDYTAELKRSSIDPAFIGAAVTIASDIEIDPLTHEPIATPLDDALGKRYTRFGMSHKPNERGYIFWNEDGSVWQVKRGLGLYEGAKRSGHYLAPKGNGNAIYTPAIPPLILARICQRHNLDPLTTSGEIASAGGFWPWLRTRKDLPLIVTEGAKKALAALSQGHIALALYGCRCGKSKALQDFLEGRETITAFDADSKKTAQREVIRGIHAIRKAVKVAGGQLRIAQWHPDEGKGLDDFITQTGPAAFDTATRQAMPIELWQALRELSKPLGAHKPDVRVTFPCLTAIHPDSIPKSGLVVISSGLGTGKTKLITKAVEGLEKVISAIHRISLGQGQSETVGLDYIGNADEVEGHRIFIGANGLPTFRIGLCWDSLLKLNLADYPPGSFDLLLDEGDQGFRHLLLGATCGKNGMRPELIKRALYLIRNAKRVILASGTLTAAEIDLLATIRGEQPYIIQNDYQGNCYPVTFYTGEPGVNGSASRARGAVISQVMTRLSEGQRGAIATDQRAICKRLEVMAHHLGFTPEQVLRIDQDTSGNDRQQEFLSATDKLRWLMEHDIKLLVYSPSMTSGVSIEGAWFDFVAGIFEGKTISPQDALQQLARVRASVPRIIYAAAKGMRDRVGATYAKAYQAETQKRTQLFEKVTGRTVPKDESYIPINAYIHTIQAQRNKAMTDFSSYLRTHLEQAGHTVTIGDADQVPWVERARELWSQWRGEIKAADQQALLEALIIGEDRARELEDQQRLTYAEALQLKRYKLCEFYKIHPEALTLEDIEQDKGGQMGKAITRLENLCYEGLARSKDTKVWDRLTRRETEVLLHDFPHHELRTKGAIAAGFAGIVMRMVEATETGQGWHQDTDWVKHNAQHLRERRDDIARATGFSISPNWSDVQVIGQLRAYLGLKSTRSRKTINGKRTWVYGLDMDAVAWLKAVLHRRASSLLSAGFDIQATPLTVYFLAGVDRAEVAPASVSIIDAFCEEKHAEDLEQGIQMDLCEYDAVIDAAYAGDRLARAS